MQRRSVQTFLLFTLFSRPSAILPIATGFTDFGECAVFVDKDPQTCDVVTSPTNPLDFVIRMIPPSALFSVKVTLRDGDCSEANQVHVYTDIPPRYDDFSGSFRRCRQVAAAAASVGAISCTFHCTCTYSLCESVFVRVFGRLGPARSLCEVEVISD